MDSLRTFKSFQNQSFKRVERSPGRTRVHSESVSRSQNSRPAMRQRDLSGKASLDREEILKKLENNKAGKFKPKQAKGKQLGVGFMQDEGPSDVGVNNPNDPMTSEKLKSVLQSGAVNFSGKEKEVLAKILNG